MCTHHIWGDDTGLMCTRTDPHSTGCTFAASAGADLDNEGGEDA